MLGFIGAGNMASAIIKGLTASASKEEIAVFDLSKEKCLELKENYGVSVFTSSKEIAEKSDTIVLSVKPNVIASVIDEIKDIVKEKNSLVISIAAGKTIEFITDCFGFEVKLTRVMPNINAVALSAVSAYTFSKSVTEKDKDTAKKFCSSFGEAFEIPENLFSIYSAIGGCAPAFTYMYIDALKTAGIKNGMTASLALKVAAAQVMGSAKMILESEEHPSALVDKVCSPGGTTIEGVATLHKNGFTNTVIEAVDSSYIKDKKL